MRIRFKSWGLGCRAYKVHLNTALVSCFALVMSEPRQ